jgi:hypothetical protein
LSRHRIERTEAAEGEVTNSADPGD